MIDLNNGTEKLEAADGFLTKLKSLLKKHWGLLLLILFVWFIYWSLTSETNETTNNTPNTTDTTFIYPKESYVIKAEYFIDGYGDTVYVDYYNDGYIDRYYSNGDKY